MSAVETGYPYSTVRRGSGLLFLSGEVAFDDSGAVPEGVAAQTRLVLARIERTLQKEGLGLANIVSATVHLARAEDFAAFNDEYSKVLRSPFPARTTLEAKLVDDVLVEISVIACEVI